MNLCGSDLCTRNGSRKNVRKGIGKVCCFHGSLIAFVTGEWIAMFDILMVYGVSGRMLEGIKPFYNNAEALIRQKVKNSECREA